MSHITTITRNTFNKVFKNLANELNTMIENIQLGISYKEGNQSFTAYKNFKLEKQIMLGDYVGAAIDWSGGTVIIESTIAQAGAKYAKEFNTPIDNIKVIMQYNNGELPNAVLLNNNEKVRKIDIETEFLK
jgi:hypothetical protein